MLLSCFFLARVGIKTGSEPKSGVDNSECDLKMRALSQLNSTHPESCLGS